MGKISDAIEKHQKEKLAPARRMMPQGQGAEAPGLSRTLIKEARVSPDGFDPRLVVLSAPNSMDAENFKILRSQILFRNAGARPRVIMVSSALPGEGKSFVAANLGISIAQGLDQHVLLMDCDFRRPNLHNLLGHANREGLQDYLAGHKDLPALLQRTKIKRLSFLGAGTASSNPSELLSSSSMRECLRELKDRYEDRYVIIDTTPMQLTAEANALVNYVDGILLVIMAHKTPRDAVRSCIDKLGKDKMLGVVFNGYSPTYGGYYKY